MPLFYYHQVHEEMLRLSKIMTWQQYIVVWSSDFNSTSNQTVFNVQLQDIGDVARSYRCKLFDNQLKELYDDLEVVPNGQVFQR